MTPREVLARHRMIKDYGEFHPGYWEGYLKTADEDIAALKAANLEIVEGRRPPGDEE